MAVAQLTTGVTLDQYRRVRSRLAETSPAVPGRLLQVCYGNEADLQILTVYESQEACDEFNRSVLKLIIDELGLADSLATRNYSNESSPVHAVIVAPALHPSATD